MTVQKSIEYNSLDSNGQISSDKYNFKLNILEDSGNYLIHRDILRHQLSQKQGTVSTKTRSEIRGGGKKPWQQKELVSLEEGTLWTERYWLEYYSKILKLKND